MDNQTRKNSQGVEVEVPRRVALRLFLGERQVSSADLAKRFDVSLSMVSRVLAADEAPTRYVDALRDEYGVPEELLPVGRDKKPGPQPKADAA